MSPKRKSLKASVTVDPTVLKNCLYWATLSFHFEKGTIKRAGGGRERGLLQSIG